MEQKIKQDIRIGENIRKIRKMRKLGQTDLVRILQIDGCDMTRECLTFLGATFVSRANH